MSNNDPQLFSNLSLEETTDVVSKHHSSGTTIKHGILREAHKSHPLPFIRCLSESLHQLGVIFESELIPGCNLVDTLALNAIRYRRIELEGFEDNVEFGLLIAVFDSNSKFSIVEKRSSTKQIIEYKAQSEASSVQTNFYNYLREAEEIYEIYPPLPFNLSTLQDFLGFIFRSFNRELLIVALFSALANILQLFFPYLTTYVTTTVLNLGSISFVLQVSMLAVILTALSVSCLYLQSRYILKLESESDKRAQVSVWDRLLKADLELLSKYNSVDLAQRAFAVSKIKELLSAGNIIAFVNVFFSMFYLITMYIYDPTSLLSILPIVVLFILIIITKSTSGGEFLSDSLAASARVTSQGREILHSLSELRARGLENIFLKSWTEFVVDLSKFSAMSRVKDNYIEVASQAFQPLCFLVSFIVIFYRMEHYNSTESLVQLLGYVSALTLFTTNLSSGASSLADEIVSVLAYWSRSKPVVFTSIEPGYGPTAQTIEIKGNLSTHNLGFSYGDKPLFTSQNIHILPKSINFISAKSGTGLTTFFKILVGLYTPNSGYITYEHKKLEDIQISYLRSQITLSPQEPFIPLGPLGDLVDTQFTQNDQNLTELLDLLGLTPLISSLRMGLNTPIPQGATCFGTKQRQLLSLARSLSKHTPCIILDNCTSTFTDNEKINILKYLKKYNITTIYNDSNFDSHLFPFDQVIDFDSNLVSQ